MGVGVQAHKGQVVGAVLPVGLQAAHREGRAADAAVAEGLDEDVVAQLVQVPDLDVEVLDELLHLLPGGHACLDVVLVVGVHVLVEAAVGDGVAVALDQDDAVGQVDQLDGLPEGAGRVLRDPGAVGGHLLQLALPDGVGRLGGLGGEQLGIALDVADGAGVGDLGGPQEVMPLQVLGVGQVQLGQVLLDLLADAAEAHAQQPVVIQAQVAGAAVDVGVGEEDALARVGALQLLLGEQGVGVVLHAAVLPEVLEGLQAALGLGGVGEVVVGALLAVVHQAVAHLVADPVQAELGVDGGALLVAAQAAHDELVIVDVQRGVLQHVGDAVGALDLLGLAGVGLVGLGHQLGPLGGDEAVGGAGSDLQDVVDAGEGGGLGGVARQAHAPLLVKGLHRQGVDVHPAGVLVHVLVPGQVLLAGQRLDCCGCHKRAPFISASRALFSASIVTDFPRKGKQQTVKNRQALVVFPKQTVNVEKAAVAVQPAPAAL